MGDIFTGFKEMNDFHSWGKTSLLNFKQYLYTVYVVHIV